MKYSDKNLSPELRNTRDNHIINRWFQLYSLSKDSGESAIKYLFATNAGGAVAVLAYLGAIASNGEPHLLAKLSVIIFFIGIIFVGIYKAYMVHRFESLFSHYQLLVSEYYDDKTGWGALTKSDETKVGKPIAPYIFGYISFFSFIVGSIVAACGVK